MMHVIFWWLHDCGSRFATVPATVSLLMWHMLTLDELRLNHAMACGQPPPTVCCCTLLTPRWP